MLVDVTREYTCTDAWKIPKGEVTDPGFTRVVLLRENGCCRLHFVADCELGTFEKGKRYRVSVEEVSR